MKITYSADIDAAYIQLTVEQVKADHSEPFIIPFLNAEVIADVDSDGRIIGLEVPHEATRILGASVIANAEAPVPLTGSP